MVITATHIPAIVALIAGILILVMPRLLNFIVAIYLIIVGLVGLNGIYHFMRRDRRFAICVLAPASAAVIIRGRPLFKL